MSKELPKIKFGNEVTTGKPDSVREAYEQYMTRTITEPGGYHWGCTNHYSDRRVSYVDWYNDVRNPEVLRSNFRFYMMQHLETKVILVGDMARYIDSYHTGIPLTGEREMLAWEQPFYRHIPDHRTGDKPIRSKLARKVHEVLADLKGPVLLLNLVPFILHSSTSIAEERQPLREEASAFAFSALMLLRYMQKKQGAKFVAIGKTTAKVMDAGGVEIVGEYLPLKPTTELDDDWQSQLRDNLKTAFKEAD